MNRPDRDSENDCDNLQTMPILASKNASQESVEEASESLPNENRVVRPEFFNSDSDIASEYSDMSSIKDQLEPIEYEGANEQMVPNLVHKTNKLVQESLSQKATNNKMRMFKSKANVHMSASNINQVLPIEHAKHFRIIWKDISYRVKVLDRQRYRVIEKQILHDLSGEFQSGQVAAIMGPSGAGKSTFLEIVACRRNMGLTGEMKVMDATKLKITYVPQENHLMESLTVLESLTFAAKLQYSTQPSMLPANIEMEVNKLIKQFGLETIRNTKVARCSGGQQKRISIALELFSRPNVLILDEPTTGLDSPSCGLVVRLLKQLVSNAHHPMAIICTIHQPAWNIFTQFNIAYIMTRTGGILYSGSPNKILPLLSKINLECDAFNSPSDYIIEIAAEDYGLEPIARLQEQLPPLSISEQELAGLALLRSVREIRATPLLKSCKYLLQRGALINGRNSLVYLFRIVAITLLSVWFSVMFGADIGRAAGCPKRKLELFQLPVEKLSTLFEESLLQVTQNSCCLFFGLMVGLIAGMTSVVLEFPREMNIITKEYNNGWYSCMSIYISKSLLDIPMQVIIPSIYIFYIYENTNQPAQAFREAYFLLITIMISFISESIGAISSAIFMNNPSAAAFLAGAIPLPMVLFGGFLVKYSRMPFYMKAVSWLSMLKYAFEGLMISIYGFNRCALDYAHFVAGLNGTEIKKPMWVQYLPIMMSTLGPVPNITDASEIDNADEDDLMIKQIYSIALQTVDNNTKVSFDRSLILNYFELENDDILYHSIIALLIYYAIIKVLTYFIIFARLNFKY